MSARSKRQLEMDFEAIEELCHMMGAAMTTVEDLAKRLGPQTPEVSARIVLQHCEKALRIANGAPMAPHARKIVKSAWEMVKRELAA